MEINLSYEELLFCKDIGQKRYNSNRNAKNLLVRMDISAVSYYTDFLGMMGEYAVAKALNLNLEEHKFFYEQEEFRRVKTEISDVLEYEVKTCNKDYKRLQVKPEDCKKYGKDRKLISCVASVNIKERTGIVNIRGYATVNMMETKGSLETYYGPAYYLPNNLLVPITNLPAFKFDLEEHSNF
jgi:hypothetical protein